MDKYKIIGELGNERMDELSENKSKVKRNVRRNNDKYKFESE